MYVPSEKKFYYLKTADKEQIAETAVHELTHAMQDQQIDLTKFLGDCGMNFDLYTARRALIEGEATCVGLNFTLNERGTSVEQIPIDLGVMIATSQPYYRNGGVFKEWFNFQYSCGSTFMQAYVKDQGWKRVPRLYKNPPLSTEQMMHPGKYHGGIKDYPVSIQLRIDENLLGEGWEPQMLTSLGEYMMGSLLESSLGDPDARKALVGWDGDEWAFFTNESTGQTAGIGLTEWDSETDAKEFVELYSRHITQTRGATPDFVTVRRTLRDIDIMVWRRGETAYVLARRDSEVLVLDGVPIEKISEIVRDVFRKAKRVYHPRDRYYGRRDRETTVVAEMAYSYRVDVVAAVRNARFGGRQDNVVGGEGGNLKSRMGFFTISIERDEWQVEAPEDIPNHFAMMHTSIKLMIGFREMPLQGFPGVAAVIQGQLEMDMENFDSVKVIEKVKFKVDGHDAYCIRMLVTDEGESVILCRIIIPHEKFVLLIDYIAHPDDAEAAEEAVKKLLGTLKFAK